MGTIKIYISIKDGKAEYRDTEKHEGKTITTEVNRGDKIVWKLDQCSGIKELVDIQVIGSAEFFMKAPKKKDFDRFKARVSNKATGEVEYYFDIIKCDGSTAKIAMRSGDGDQVKDPETPKLKIKE